MLRVTTSFSRAPCLTVEGTIRRAWSRVGLSIRMLSVTELWVAIGFVPAKSFSETLTLRTFALKVRAAKTPFPASWSSSELNVITALTVKGVAGLKEETAAGHALRAALEGEMPPILSGKQRLRGCPAVLVTVQDADDRQLGEVP